MPKHSTIPEYGASIKIEDASAGLYLREKALDAVQEQVVEDLNAALERLNGRGILAESDFEAIRGLLGEIQDAAALAEIAAEIAFSKKPVEEDEA